MQIFWGTFFGGRQQVGDQVEPFDTDTWSRVVEDVGFVTLKDPSVEPQLTVSRRLMRFSTLLFVSSA